MGSGLFSKGMLPVDVSCKCDEVLNFERRKRWKKKYFQNEY